MQEAYDKEPQVKELVDTARKLEGLVRGAGLHAAGVVIAPQPLTELVPVCRSKNDEIVTAYDMKAVEKLGLLKMDFLGLTTLTVIDDALKLIEKQARKRARYVADPAGRCRDLREGLSPRAHLRSIPVRVRRHARCAAPLQACFRGRSDRPQRALSSRARSRAA